jgi:hypothetical protein
MVPIQLLKVLTLQITHTTSTDKDTGALIVQNGGAGIELNLNVGGTGKFGMSRMLLQLQPVLYKF